MPKGICSMEDCNKLVKAKGLCSTHHQQWYRATTNPTPVRRKRQPCVIKGCDRLTDGHEHYCKNHKRKLLLYGDPLGGRKVIFKCTVEGCNNWHRAKGLCGKHYAMARKLETTTLTFVIKKLDQQIKGAESKDQQEAFTNFKRFLESVRVPEIVSLVGVSSG